MKTRTFAEICARQGEFDEAIAIYRSLIAKSPTDTSLKSRLLEIENLKNGVFDTTPKLPKNPKVQKLEALLQRITSRRRR